ncbi:lipid-A-disaccharide synthase N-terminal domain-containing protein [Cetobacterium sp.]
MMGVENWNIFLVIGFVGQGLFSMRFIIQWLASEKAKKSVIPFSFWTLSLSGSVFLLIYAIYKRDPVFILGQAPNVLIYSRNIYLIRKNKGVEE